MRECPICQKTYDNSWAICIHCNKALIDENGKSVATDPQKVNIKPLQQLKETWGKFYKPLRESIKEFSEVVSGCFGCLFCIIAFVIICIIAIRFIKFVWYAQ